MTFPQWDLVGGDPARGDPCAFEGLRSHFWSAAECAGNAATRLRHVGQSVDCSVWRGESADAFAAQLAELPGQLAKLQESYARASLAARTYGNTLRGLQTRARAAVARAVDARAAADVQERARMHALSADPLAETSGMECAADRARARLRAARAEIDGISGERRDAESALVGGLTTAGREGIPNDGFSWRKVLRQISEVMHDLAAVLVVAGLVIIAVVAIVGLLPVSGAIAGALLAAKGVGIALLAAGVRAEVVALGVDVVRYLTGDDTAQMRELLLGAVLLKTNPVVGILLDIANRGAPSRGSEALAPHVPGPPVDPPRRSEELSEEAKFDTVWPEVGDHALNGGAAAFVELLRGSDLPNAAFNLGWYLKGSGEDLIIDPDVVAASSDKFASAVDGQVARGAELAVAEAYNENRLGKPVAFSVDWENVDIGPDDSLDWYLALHGVSVSTTGYVVVDPSTSDTTVHYQVHIYDPYDWDEPVHVPGMDIPVQRLYDLHEAGLAREYDVRGTSAEHTTLLGELVH